MFRPRALGFALLSIALVAAGCVTPPGDTNAATTDVTDLANWWERAIPSSLTDPNHDHGVRAQHANLTTPNFEVVGYDSLITDHYGTTLTGMGCGGTVTREDGMRLAIVHSISTDVSFVVADVTDPTAPVMLGEYYMPNAVVWDADITADGMHVLVGAYPLIFGGDPVLPPIPPAIPSGVALPQLEIVYRDACTGAERAVGPESYVPFGPGIVMIGIADPSNPTFEDWVSQPAIGPHSVSSALIDGTVFATSSVTNLNHEGSYYSIFQVVGPKLVPYTVINAPGTRSTENPLDNGHIDVYIEKHPVTGATLAYLANWNAGMHVYDISLPGPAMHVAEWSNGAEGNIHTTYTFPAMVGDKHYMLVGQEVGEPVDLPSGWIYILDITDPSAPAEVSRWTLPVKPKWDDGGLQFSPHYVAVLNNTMFVTNYHGGMWAVDISNLTEPLASGIFVPDRDSDMPFGGAETYGPGIEDVIVDHSNGVLTVWDAAGGVYSLRFDDSVPVPRAPAWPFVAPSE